MSGIWIRSQDKKLLLELNGFSTYNHGIAITIEGFSTLSNVDYTWCLGTYSSEENTDKVLDMIHQHIEDSNCEMYNRSVDSDVLGAIATQTNYIFKMPLDSEVVADET